MRELLQRAVDEAFASSERVFCFCSVSGGCIHQAFQITLGSGSQIFAKVNHATNLPMFQVEARGLKALAATNSIRTSKVIGEAQVVDSCAILLMEFVSSGKKSPEFNDVFAQQLAELHLSPRAESSTDSRSFGLDHDNFLGSSPQRNSPNESWIDFFRNERLGFQLQLARNNGMADPSLLKMGDRLSDRLDGLLIEPGFASLIHGDLWSGNYLCDENAAPVLIDPAIYFGDREAEFGMLTLFGGLNQRFYDAYLEAAPLPDGYSERFEIYKLYHVLNHLNLFGRSYLDQCKAVIQKFI